MCQSSIIINLKHFVYLRNIINHVMANVENSYEHQLLSETAHNIGLILENPSHRIVYDPKVDELLSLNPKINDEKSSKYPNIYFI